MNGVGWGVLGEGDLADLVRLWREARAVDGGLPLAGEAYFLRSRYLSPGAATLAGRDRDGKLVAAGAVRLGPGEETITCIGQVSPEAREHGLGAHVLDWALAEATGTGRAVAVESETLTSSARALFASRGLRQFFAEDVMGIDPTDLDPAVWPAGTELVDWTDASALAFHESLGRMWADGATRALLTVNVDNPAARLHEHIGFTHQGRRARYRLP